MNEEGVLLENLDFRRLHWNSDFSGDEVGYPDINIVGYYVHGGLNLYIDIETDIVLEMWFDEEEEG